MESQSERLPQLSPEELRNPHTKLKVNGMVMELWQVAHLYGIDVSTPDWEHRTGATAMDVQRAFHGPISHKSVENTRAASDSHNESNSHIQEQPCPDSPTLALNTKENHSPKNVNKCAGATSPPPARPVLDLVDELIDESWDCADNETQATKGNEQCQQRIAVIGIKRSVKVKHRPDHGSASISRSTTTRLDCNPKPMPARALPSIPRPPKPMRSPPAPPTQGYLAKEEILASSSKNSLTITPPSVVEGHIPQQLSFRNRLERKHSHEATRSIHNEPISSKHTRNESESSMEQVPFPELIPPPLFTRKVRPQASMGVIQQPRRQVRPHASMGVLNSSRRLVSEQVQMLRATSPHEQCDRVVPSQKVDHGTWPRRTTLPVRGSTQDNTDPTPTSPYDNGCATQAPRSTTSIPQSGGNKIATAPTAPYTTPSSSQASKSTTLLTTPSSETNIQISDFASIQNPRLRRRSRSVGVGEWLQQFETDIPPVPPIPKILPTGPRQAQASFLSPNEIAVSSRNNQQKAHQQEYRFVSSPISLPSFSKRHEQSGSSMTTATADDVNPPQTPRKTSTKQESLRGMPLILSPESRTRSVTPPPIQEVDPGLQSR